MILRSIALAGAAVCTLASAHAGPCTLIPDDSSQRCQSTAQHRTIVLSDLAEPSAEGITLYQGGRATIIEPKTSDDTAVQIIYPHRMAQGSCSGGIGLIPDFSENARRYEVCLSDLDGDDGLDVAAAFKRISRAVDRTCRANGAGTYPALKFCRRDTLYRAIIDTSLPALTAHYVTETGRSVPRIEVDPAKTY